MIWFPFYASDFIGATVGLSCQEVSIYNWMLTLYYELGPFPEDRVRTYRIVRCESDEQKRTVDFLLGQFFVLRDGNWFSEKAEKVLVRQAKISQRAREKAEKRWSAAAHDAAALLQQSMGNAPAMQSKAKAKGKEKEKREGRASRFSLAELPENWKDYCQLKRPELDPALVFEDFSDYWIAKAGKDSSKSDWQATWRRWVRNEGPPKAKANGNDLTRGAR